MALEGVVRGSKKEARVILYGPPGVGKSTFGADSTKPVFITTEDGVDNLPVDQFPKAKNWEELLANVRKVATEKHEYKTAVVDGLNGMVDLCNADVCNTLYGGQWEPVRGKEGFLSFYRGYKASAEETRKMTAILDACRARGMMVILLAHMGLHNVKHPTGGEYTKFAPDVYKDIWAVYSAWADIVLRADYEYAIIPPEGGKGKGRAIGTQTRVMFAQGSAAEDAKCRVGYELPDQLPLSFDAFKAALGQGGDTLEEIKQLWNVLSKTDKKKAMAWLGVAKMEDASLTKCRQLLNRLRQKQAEKVVEAEEVKETA